MTRIAGRDIVFPRIWPARSVGNRTMPVTLQPAPPPTAPNAVAGGWAASYPGSRSVIDGDAVAPGRGYMGRTEDDLNTGLVPNRIDRLTTARDDGKISSRMAGWPYDGNALMMPALIIQRTPNSVTVFARTIDTGVTIPSLPIGGPV